MGYITRKLRQRRAKLRSQVAAPSVLPGPPINIQKLRGQQDRIILAGRGLRFGSILPRPIPLPTASAQKLANEYQIDLRKVKGSGANGRVIKRDVSNFIANLNGPHPEEE